MKVTIIDPIGFCPGVINAIKKSIGIKKEYPLKKVATYGAIAHNERITATLAQQGISVVDLDVIDAKEIKELTDILIFSAHGTDLRLMNDLETYDVKTYITICPYINLIDKEIYENPSNEYLYVGIIDHVEGATFNKNYSNIPFYDIEKGIINEDQLDYKKTYKVINQTTIDEETLKDIYEHLKYKGLNIRKCNTTCQMLKEKYEALKIKLKHNKYDCVVIIGSRTSNNTKTLLKIAQKYSKTQDIYFVNSLRDIYLQKSKLTNNTSALVISGTSTPNDICEEIIEKLSSL